MKDRRTRRTLNHHLYRSYTYGQLSFRSESAAASTTSTIDIFPIVTMSKNHNIHITLYNSTYVQSTIKIQEMYSRKMFLCVFFIFSVHIQIQLKCERMMIITIKWQQNENKTATTFYLCMCGSLPK